MKTIYKYTVPIADRFEIQMPSDAIILTVQLQDYSPTVWAEVETANPKETRYFAVVGTGNPMPEGETVYIGTVQQPLIRTFVWHVFEILN